MPSYDFPGFHFQSCCCCCAFLGRFAYLALYPVLSTWEGQVLDLVTEGNFHSLLIYWMHGALALCQRFSTVTFLNLCQFLHLVCFRARGCSQYFRISLPLVHETHTSEELKVSRWLFQYSRLPETQYNFWLPEVFLFIWFPQFFIEKMLRNYSKWHLTPDLKGSLTENINCAHGYWEYFPSNFRITFSGNEHGFIDDP